MKRSVFTRIEYALDGFDVVVGVVLDEKLEPRDRELYRWTREQYLGMKDDRTIEYGDGHRLLAFELEARLQRQWPGREYFVEVGEDQMARSTQIYCCPGKSVER